MKFYKAPFALFQGTARVRRGNNEDNRKGEGLGPLENESTMFPLKMMEHDSYQTI